MATTVDQGNDISLVKSTNGGVGEPKTSGDDHVAERAVLTPARAAKKVKKSCTFYVHTMEHQANETIQPFEFKFESRPSEVTVDEIMDRTIASLSLSVDSAKKCFAMWLTSPHLQLQLKSNYHPYQLHKQWKDLLVCYTNCDFYAKENDIPILSFQRSAFLSLDDEKSIVNEAIIHLLYEEAKLNVLRGNYPMDTATVVKLAGMQAAAKSYKNKEIGIRLVDYFPYHMVRKTRGFILPKLKPPYKPSLEEQLMTAQREYSSNSIYQLERQYLDQCREMEYYGSVLFTGQIERSFTHSSVLLGHSDRPVTIGIHTQGLHIIRQSSPPEILLFLPYCEMSWHYIECHSSGEEYYSSILLEYDSVIGTKSVVKRLKIFSRQAPLMENMIKRVVNSLNYCAHIRRQDGTDETDFGSILRPKCKEHPLLVCDVMEPKPTNVLTEQPHFNGSSVPTQEPHFEMQRISSTSQEQYSQTVKVTQDPVS